MVFNPCICGVAHGAAIIKRILAKHVGEDSLVGKKTIYGLDLTLCMDPQHSCTKDLREVAE